MLIICLLESQIEKSALGTQESGQYTDLQCSYSIILFLQRPLVSC